TQLRGSMRRRWRPPPESRYDQTKRSQARVPIDPASTSRRQPRATRPALPAAVGPARAGRSGRSRADPLCDERVRLRGLHQPVDLEVLAELDVHQSGRGAVVDGRDAVACERGRVAEPPRDITAGSLAEDLLVRRVDGADELVPLLDLRAGRRDVHLALDPVVG